MERLIVIPLIINLIIKTSTYPLPFSPDNALFHVKTYLKQKREQSRIKKAREKYSGEKSEMHKRILLLLLLRRLGRSSWKGKNTTRTISGRLSPKGEGEKGGGHKSSKACNRR